MFGLDRVFSADRTKELALALWVILLYFVVLCGLSFKERIFTGKWIEIP